LWDVVALLDGAMVWKPKYGLDTGTFWERAEETVSWSLLDFFGF